MWSHDPGSHFVAYKNSLLDISKVIAGDEVETPGTELTSVVKLSSEQQGCMNKHMNIIKDRKIWAP